jgi:hypothetical protein
MKYLVKISFSAEPMGITKDNYKKTVSFSFEPRVGDLLVLNDIKLGFLVIGRVLREDEEIMEVNCKVKFLGNSPYETEECKEENLFKKELLSKGFVEIK